MLSPSLPHISIHSIDHLLCMSVCLASYVAWHMSAYPPGLRRAECRLSWLLGSKGRVVGVQTPWWCSRTLSLRHCVCHASSYHIMCRCMSICMHLDAVCPIHHSHRIHMSPHIPMSAGAMSRDQWVTDLHWHTGWSPEDIACRMSVYIWRER